MSDAISIFQRELDDALSVAAQHEFDEATIEQVFGSNPVAGNFVLQTTKWYGRGSQASGSDHDLKKHLLDYMHRRIPTGGIAPVLYFRFVPTDEMKKRMVPYGLDHLL